MNKKKNENTKQINQLQQELNRNSEALEDLDNKISRLKIEKAELRLQLKRLYLGMLKNERQLL